MDAPYAIITVVQDNQGQKKVDRMKNILLVNTQGKNMFLFHCTKMKFSINDFFSKCDQIRRKLWIWSDLLKKSLMESFIFCAVIFK